MSECTPEAMGAAHATALQPTVCATHPSPGDKSDKRWERNASHLVHRTASRNYYHKTHTRAAAKDVHEEVKPVALSSLNWGDSKYVAKTYPSVLTVE